MANPFKYLAALIRHWRNPNEHFKPNEWIESSKLWNERDYWEKYYRELIENPDRKKSLASRRASHILTLMRHLSAWKLERVLCAGCGIHAEPRLFAWHGCDVTAVDLSSKAIAVARRQTDSLDELASAIEVIFEPDESREDSWLAISDINRIRRTLKDCHRTGGTVDYKAIDWLEIKGKWDLIFCHNGLRFSPKSYWRRTLGKFHEVLAPGGVLVTRNLNAFGLREEVRDVALSAGLELLQPDHRPTCAPLPTLDRDPGKRYFMPMWPTG